MVLGNNAALATTTGGSNVAIGGNALRANTYGNNNTAIGGTSLFEQRGNGFNTGIGAYAGQQITTGVGNTAVGASAMQDNSGSGITGGGNTAIGGSSLGNIDGGAANNTAIGSGAGSLLQSGSGNTIIGTNVASGTLKSGSSNILIGTSSTVDTPATGTSNYLNIGGLLIGDVSKGHTAFGGAAGTLSACGTSPTLGASSTDHVGTVTAGSGATSCTLTWASTWSSAPSCNVTSRSGLALSYTPATGALVVTATGLGGTTFDYRCDALGMTAP
jgi:hypothetical protein